MKLKYVVALVLCCVMALPATAQQTQIDDAFRWSSFGWDGNGQTLVVWRPVIVDGKIAICGAYSSRGGSKYSNLSRQAVGDMRIDGPNGAFIRGLSFFNRVSNSQFEDQLRGAMANCRVTATSGTPADLRSYRLGFTPQRYRN